MKIKVSIQIIFKLMIIALMIFYLPSYSHQNVKLFKAISTTEALPASIPVTSNKKIHLYNTHQMILKIIKMFIELLIINLMWFLRCI